MEYLNIYLYVVVIIMVISTFKKYGRNKKNKKYIKVMQSYNDKEQFFSEINDFITTINDIEFVTKGRILKLYGCVYHNELNEVDELLDDIDFTYLFMRNGKIDLKLLDLNEDSFFYYCFYTHFITYERDNKELREKLRTKIVKEEDVLCDHLLYNIYLNSFDVFDKDEKNAYFEGNYEAINGLYSKQLISLYRIISDSLFYLSLKKSNTTIDDIENLKDELADFITKGYGERLLKSLMLFDELNEININKEKESNKEGVIVEQTNK